MLDSQLDFSIGRQRQNEASQIVTCASGSFDHWKLLFLSNLMIVLEIDVEYFDTRQASHIPERRWPIPRVLSNKEHPYIFIKGKREGDVMAFGTAGGVAVSKLDKFHWVHKGLPVEWKRDMRYKLSTNMCRWLKREIILNNSQVVYFNLSGHELPYFPVFYIILLYLSLFLLVLGLLFPRLNCETREMVLDDAIN